MKEKITSILKYRLQQAEESVKDAEILHNGGGSRRGIVNLAYYTMFYSALSLILQKGENPEQANPHAQTLEIFDREYIDTGIFPREMSEMYHSAYDLKEKGDYQDLNSISEMEIIEIINGAREFLSKLKPYLETRQIENHISQLLRFQEVIRGKFSMENFDS